MKQIIDTSHFSISSPKETSSRMLGVIDIGTTAVRMVIAQIDTLGTIEHLETLQQSVSLGKDTFTIGYIRKSSIDECIRSLKSFRRVLEEYHINKDSQIRVFATTAVREAENRDAFIDRIYIGTGFNIEIIDEIDIARLTYLSARAYLCEHRFSKGSDILIAEMSGGSTELLLLQNENVLLSKSYRLGALRLREMLGEFRASLPRQREIMESDLQRTINQICFDISSGKSLKLIALGGDARFAATQIQEEWNQTGPVKVSLPTLARFTDEITRLSIDEIVQKFHISFSEAETLGPTLLFYLHLARALDLKHIMVTDISMRSGVLIEMVMHEIWSEQFTQQIINSALELGRKFQFDEAHALHVTHLSSLLFRALQKEHGLAPWNELHLRIAALLHDVGSFISIRSHHKHSMYLIQNSELFGLNKKDLHRISLIARYHRRSPPKPVHEEYTALDRESRLAVLKLAALLRVADALDRSNSQRIQDVSFSFEDTKFVVTVSGIDDLSLEQLGCQSKGGMFEDVYGMKVIIRKKSLSLE